MFFKTLIFAIIILFFFSCGTNKIVTEPLGIGTFNIAWLGDGINDREQRNDDDYKRIAKIITEINADIIGLQEIENAMALEKLCQFLNDYKFIIKKSSGEQNVALLYKESIEISGIEEYQPLDVKVGRTRQGLVAHCKKGNFDWSMMIVHLKSTSRFDSTEEMKVESRNLRRLQSKVLSHWVDSMLTKDEKDIIIVGDLNDFPARKKEPTLTTLLENSNIEFLTKERRSCKDEKLFSIDHIIVSQSAKKRFIIGSDGTYNFFASETQENVRKISDHCPVFSRFDIVSPDND